MHPSRLAMLASRHAQRRAVVRSSGDSGGNHYTLECGHRFSTPPHFALTPKEPKPCTDCGREYVRTSPRYQSEFEPS